MAGRKIWEQRVAYCVEDGVVRDLERRSQWQVGRIEEGVAVWIYVDACRLVRSTCSDQGVQRRGRVVIDVDGKVQRVGDTTLLYTSSTRAQHKA